MIDRLLNVAVPATAVTVVVPDNTPLAGLVPTATDTFAVLEVRLPLASCTSTVTAGLIDAPAATIDG